MYTARSVVLLAGGGAAPPRSALRGLPELVGLGEAPYEMEDVEEVVPDGVIVCDGELEGDMVRVAELVGDGDLDMDGV
jgi:hypothetical protein